jgi:hypothetical protein
MEWEVEFTDEFNAWWETLSPEEQIEMDAKVRLLEKLGPVLPRPHSDVIVSSRHANMKELRGKVIDDLNQEHVLRALYAFDTRRAAILLIGGDKAGDESWYDRFVPIADSLFDDHLKTIKQEEKGQQTRAKAREKQVSAAKKKSRK